MGRCSTATTRATGGWRFPFERESTSWDNSHKVGERQMASGGPGASVPIDDDAKLYAGDLAGDRQAVPAASEALIKIKTGKEIKVETAEGHAPDFSRKRRTLPSDRRFPSPWTASRGRKRSGAYTKAFRESPAIINSIVTFSGQAQKRYQVTSEGTQLQFGQIRYRLELFIQGRRRRAWTSTAITISIGSTPRTRRTTKRSMRRKRRCARNWKDGGRAH